MVGANLVPSKKHARCEGRISGDIAQVAVTAGTANTSFAHGRHH